MKKAKRIAAAVIALFLLAGAASPATLSSAVYADGGNGSEYRTVSAGKYTVFYRYGNARLTVYRILHQRQDIDNYTLVDLG